MQQRTDSRATASDWSECVRQSDRPFYLCVKRLRGTVGSSDLPFSCARAIFIEYPSFSRCGDPPDAPPGRRHAHASRACRRENRASKALRVQENEGYSSLQSRWSVQWAAEKWLNLVMSWLHQRAAAPRMRCCMLTGHLPAPPKRALDPIRALPANLII